jgi:hypothetical protein
VWDGEPRDVERAGEVHPDDRLPGIGTCLLDGDRGAGDAGVVDQHVEAARGADGGVHHAFKVFTLGDVADRGRHPGDVACEVVQTFSSMSQTSTFAPLAANARTFFRPIQEAGAGGYQNAPSHASPLSRGGRPSYVMSLEVDRAGGLSLRIRFGFRPQN